MSDTSNTKTENTRLRILITVMAGILSVFLYYEILNVIQYQTSMVQARKEMEDAAKWLETSYPGAQEPFNIIDSCTRNLYDEDMTLLMTLINIVSGIIYTKGHPLKSKIQVYGLALVFLVLLYHSPSGLVFYWLLNNVFSLVKNIFYKLKDPKKVLEQD